MPDLAVLGLAVALGFYLKGLSGMGEAIPLAALGAWFIPVADLVVIITVLDLAGSAAAMRAARLSLVRREDMPYVLWLCLGIGVGVGILAWASERAVEVTFMASLVVVACLMVRRAVRAAPRGAVETGARRAQPGRAAMSLYAGVSGGVSGIDGPPLAAALYRARGVADIRDQLMRLLLVSAATRAVILLLGGMLTWRLVGVGAALIPVAVVFFLVSRKVHATVDPRLGAGVCAALCVASVLITTLR